MKAEEKKLHLIDELYKEIWAGTRDWQKNIIQYVAVLITIFGVLGWGLKNPEYLFISTIVSQLALLWILFVILVAGWHYTRNQMISANIEEIFKINHYGQILPPSYLSPKFTLPKIYKIHFWFFLICFILLPLFFILIVMQNKTNKCCLQECFETIEVITSWSVCFFGLFSLYDYWNKYIKKEYDDFCNQTIQKEIREKGGI